MYLEVTVKAGLNGGFKSIGNKIPGMVKYAAANKYIVGGRRIW